MEDTEKMDWGRLLSSKRFGLEDYDDDKHHNRTRFQRDYDRLIFSAPFRRLQNKTQVFPLPGSVFVHNRLTHSLEVSSVGRSLGSIIASHIEESTTDVELLRKLPGIPDIVATACLAHDMGNPPFGHSGETAIGSYFSEGKGLELRGIIGERLWRDLSHFEGNANAFRLLTHHFKGRRKGGYALTYSTLASIVKYPYESALAGAKGKFGFFVSEEEHYKKVATELGILNKGDGKQTKYCRHPLVYLVEAADDICYQIMDIEDSHKLKILTTNQTKEYLLAFFEEEKLSHVEEILSIIEDKNEQVAYLRSSIVGLLVSECAEAFIKHEDEILRGECTKPLIDMISDTPRKAYEACSAMAYEKIYNYSGVLDIELAGNQIVNMLLDKLIDAVLHPDKSYSQLLLAKVPQQYDMRATDIPTRIQAVTDYISGMTDVYALDLYQKLNGMSLPVI